MLDFDWLIGTWQHKTGNGIAYERWTKVSDRTFEGDGFSIVGDDTTHLEFLRLAEFGGEVFLCAKSRSQQISRVFKLIRAEEGSFVFEHPEHDFPQRIICQRQGEDKQHVRVEAERDKNEWH
jgi:hypothetical protein